MKFSEIPLYDAIHDVRAEMDADLTSWPYSSGSDEYTDNTEQREAMCKAVASRAALNCPFPLMGDVIPKAWKTYRKHDKGMYVSLVVQAVRLYGPSCFWSSRGLGECSEHVTVDLLIPESRGGVRSLENCVVACNRHTAKRGGQPIEAFLLGSLAGTEADEEATP